MKVYVHVHLAILFLVCHTTSSLCFRYIELFSAWGETLLLYVMVLCSK